jgi:para-nitrobenzyl esterase
MMRTTQGVGLLLSLLTLPLVVAGCAEEGVYCVDGVCYDGYYYDSLVSGVTYESTREGGPVQTGVTGERNDPGRFRYQEGDTVTFSIGDTVLGQAPAQERVTPFDLAGLEEEHIGNCEVDGTLPDTTEFRIVHNVAVLLQTLDTDGDPTAGIEISPEVAALFDGRNIDVSQAWEDFQTDTDLAAVLDEANSQSLFPDARELSTREEALRALYKGIGLCP